MVMYISPWRRGLLGFYCLTGQHYWRSGRGSDASLQQILREVLIDELASPEERAKELGVTLPAGFEEWFKGCVQRDPTARFSDASAAHQALRRLVHVPRGAAGFTSRAPRSEAPSRTDAMPPSAVPACTAPMPPSAAREYEAASAATGASVILTAAPPRRDAGGRQSSWPRHGLTALALGFLVLLPTSFVALRAHEGRLAAEEQARRAEEAGRERERAERERLAAEEQAQRAQKAREEERERERLAAEEARRAELTKAKERERRAERERLAAKDRARRAEEARAPEPSKEQRTGKAGPGGGAPERSAG